ncbi:MAG: HAD-IIIA family hydrolase [Patescibacteria group bacterium]
MSKKRAVFIDRDGVVVKPVYHEGFTLPTAPFHFQEFAFLDLSGTLEALSRLKKNGFLCILITNQPDVAYGHILEEEWQKIHRQVRTLAFDDIFMCRHTREVNCPCKKPKPGMLFLAAEMWNIDLSRSYMVGDTQNDMLAGQAAGCKTVLVRTNYNIGIVRDYASNDLLSAAKMILSMEKGGVR